jgi:hypothetical protein
MRRSRELTGTVMEHPWSAYHCYMKCPFKGQNKTTPKGGFIQNKVQLI